MIREADWKHEKHVPVIEVEKEGEDYRVTVSVGKEIPHPNLPEHHISWIELYFIPEGDNTPYPLGRADFLAHGVKNLVSEPRAVFYVSLPGPGKLVALALCNIHGLWKGEKEVR